MQLNLVRKFSQNSSIFVYSQATQCRTPFNLTRFSFHSWSLSRKTETRKSRGFSWTKCCHCPIQRRTCQQETQRTFWQPTVQWNCTIIRALSSVQHRQRFSRFLVENLGHLLDFSTSTNISRTLYTIRICSSGWVLSNRWSYYRGCAGYQNRTNLGIQLHKSHPECDVQYDLVWRSIVLAQAGRLCLELCHWMDTDWSLLGQAGTKTCHVSLVIHFGLHSVPDLPFVQAQLQSVFDNLGQFLCHAGFLHKNF